MLVPQNVYNLLKEAGFEFFTGVPDSLLKDFCAYITDHSTHHEHVIAANEGNAIALAAGHYLGKKTPAIEEYNRWTPDNNLGDILAD